MPVTKKTIVALEDREGLFGIGTYGDNAEITIYDEFVFLRISKDQFYCKTRNLPELSRLLARAVKDLGLE